MNFRSFTSLFVSVALCFPSLALADDAYEDDEEVDRPRADDGFDDEEDETLEDDSLEAGGMKAPDALGEAGDQRSEIEKELDESEQRDSGRGLEFVWLSADLGFQALSLDALSDGGLVPAGGTSGGSGLTFGGAAGLRLLYFTAGARFRYAVLGDFSSWSLLGEAALRVPIGKLEPYALAGVGYLAVPGLGEADGVGGIDVRLGGGLDYYLSDSFSAGAQVSGDLLFLSGSTGTAMGAGATAALLLGLHF